jgi:MFS transporter, MHS family, proline/betaine transporter
MANISASSMAGEEPRSVARQRVVLAATIGNTLEWYDFLIYGFLAVTIAKLFFPTEDELTSLLLSVGTFGAAAVVRPLRVSSSASMQIALAVKRP